MSTTAPIVLREVPLPASYFQKKVQISRTTWWRYEKCGLPVIKVGGKTFCRESDFVAFLERMNGHTAGN